MSEIESAVRWELIRVSDKNIIEKQKPKFRRTDVYKIEKRLFHESEFIPSKLIFTSDDFLKYEIEEYHIDLSGEKFKEKVTKYFEGLFHIRTEISNLSFEQIDCKTKGHELVKSIKVSDDNSNCLWIEINISNLHSTSEKKSVDDKPRGLQADDLRMFITSPLFKSKTELNVYKKREKGRLEIRSFEIDSKIHMKNYIENVSLNDPKKKYILNLRGLLKYLTSYQSKTPYIKINKVIENLCQIDKYWTIENELFGFYYIPKDTLQETENFIPKQGLVEHRVKQGFPFLSFYNQYKHLLPNNYASQILVEISLNLKDKLETLELAELKYQTTELFFSKIHDYFWESSGFSEPKIDNRELIPLPAYNLLKEYQKEIRYYLSQIKEGKSRTFVKQGQYYEENVYRHELEDKISEYLYQNKKPVIWIKEILYPNDPDTIPVELTGPEISVIKETCESSGLKYVTNKGFFLFKQTFIEKIKGCLESNMPLEMAKKLVLNHGINNETAIRDVIVLSGFKTMRIGTGPRVIIKRSD